MNASCISTKKDGPRIVIGNGYKVYNLKNMNQFYLLLQTERDWPFICAFTSNFKQLRQSLENKTNIMNLNIVDATKCFMSAS